jgi:hypothetical protein
LVGYQEQAEAARGVASSLPNPESVQSNQVPAYTTLVADYGLPLDMHFVTSNNVEQTVEEEFCSYISGLLSPPETPLLKFWEVRDMLTAAHQTSIDHST